MQNSSTKLEKRSSLFKSAAQGILSHQKMTSSQEFPRINDRNGSNHKQSVLQIADSNQNKKMQALPSSRKYLKTNSMTGTQNELTKDKVGYSSQKLKELKTKEQSNGFKSIQRVRPISKNNSQQKLSSSSFSKKRKFSEQNDNKSQNLLASINKDNDTETNELKKLAWIRKNIIGFNTRYYSQLKLQVESVYIDHTATNRPFKPVETMVDHSKLLIANPHTEFSRFGKFSTQLMHQALGILLKCFNTNEKEFVALPTGSGSTGAIQKALHVFQDIEWTKNAEIFITPYEHHSNILPWIEFHETLNVLQHGPYGYIDAAKAENQIRQKLKKDKGIIVSISAASNVTSQLTDLVEMNNMIGRLRSEGNKNIIFAADCAAFCCHHHLDLLKYNELDFAFLSPHKNLGGAESCGILLARKSLFNSEKPTFPGGGTVRFVKGYSKQDVLYEVDPFSREIAGTPPFLGFYRAALSFQLLTNVIGYDFIHAREAKNTKLFFKLIEQSNIALKEEGKDTMINIYGSKDLNKRANVATFNFEYGPHFIQHSFASLLYTDVFGIQIRSGCFCAGPFGIELLNIDKEKVAKIQEQVQAGIMINKPGYLRLDLTFYLEDYEIEYIAAATLLIARYWRNFAKLYTICNDGEILLLPIFKRQIPDLYSLADLKRAESILKKQENTQREKLSRRRQTLEFAMKRAESIAKNPIDFLKKVKSGSDFKIDELSN